MNSIRNINKVKGKLYGLILSGGKSTRMGTDKGTIIYHGLPQREFLYNMLNAICERTFLSIRADQQQGIPGGKDTIVDKDEYKGPFNGIMSAHNLYKDIAWLVLACDLPLINPETISRLISLRDPTRDATALATKESGLPEPLAAIWEPHGLAKAMVHLQNTESSCPRKFLMSSDISIVFPESDLLLSNANSPLEYEEIRQNLASQ